MKFTSANGTATLTSALSSEAAELLSINAMLLLLLAVDGEISQKLDSTPTNQPSTARQAPHQQQQGQGERVTVPGT